MDYSSDSEEKADEERKPESPSVSGGTWPPSSGPRISCVAEGSALCCRRGGQGEKIMNRDGEVVLLVAAWEKKMNISGLQKS